jgi:cardiolipin synthase C
VLPLSPLNTMGFILSAGAAGRCAALCVLRAMLFSAFLPLILMVSPTHAEPELGDVSQYSFSRTVLPMIEQHAGASGAYILEEGEENLVARTWLVQNAVESISILTFIYSFDTIGMIATQALVDAADRGVHVRIVVDDMLLYKEPMDILLAMAAHPLIEIRIYNPVRSVGVSTFRMVLNVISDFRRFNQRLHNKTFLADGVVGICGGRNVANEYFDYEQEYHFRDRDILVVGPVVEQLSANFEAFWVSELSKPVESLLADKAQAMTQEEIEQVYLELSDTAERLLDTLVVVRSALEQQDAHLRKMIKEMVWTTDIWFVSDRPGTNLGKPGLGGGGEMMDALREAILSAQKSITVHSPYFVVAEGELGFFRKAREGVEIRVITNSLASTDNIAAFSGYAKSRDKLLAAGMTLREFRPHPALEQEEMAKYVSPGQDPPIIVMHAKTMVIDGELVYIGTYNFDPRSANLSTEEGVFVRSRELARRIEALVDVEMREENSWNPEDYSPDRYANWWRRFKLWFFQLWPIRPLL